MRDRAERLKLLGLPPRIAASRVLLGLLVALDLGIGAFCLADGLRWVGEPFPGFLVNERMRVNGMGRYGWSGTRLGLKPPDKILTANGEPVASGADLARVVRSVPVGEPVHYAVERSGAVQEVAIPTMRFGWADFAVVPGILALLGIAYLAIGAVVFALKPDSAMSWSFFLLALAVSLYSLTAFDVAATHRGFVRVYLIAFALGPAAGLHLAMQFPQPWNLLRRHPRVQGVPYAVAAAVLLPLLAYYPAPAFLPFYRALFFYLIVASLIFVGGSLAAYLRPSSDIGRQRSKVVLFGAALAFPVVAVGELAMFSGTTLAGFQVQANFLALPFTLFPISIAYAIARHNLFDVDVYIKRTLGYVVMTAIVGFAYFSLQAAASLAASRTALGAQAGGLHALSFALLVVLFFNPVNRRVQGGVERLFFRRPYDYKATVASLSDARGAAMDLDAFLRHVLELLRTRLFVDRVGVILVDDRKRACRALFRGDGGPGAPGSDEHPPTAYGDPLLALLAREGKLVSLYDVAEDARHAAVREECVERFDALGASVVFPLAAEGGFAGALALGHKKSGHFFSREDIDLLNTASTMISTAIEQARDKGQRDALMQLFAKHVSPEVAESLWAQREQFLEGGRPRSQKITATILFSDLAGFSAVSERLDPETLMDWLNTYMEAITRVIMDHGGVVDDYFGDGIKVNFGVPVPRTSQEEVCEDAVHAVDCALALEREMVRLNAAMEQRGLPANRLRVGIFTGWVVAGSLGSADRMKYTTLGDTVNTAARLESYDKSLELPHLQTSPCRILLGDATLRHLGGRYETQRVGELALKGKHERVVVHCVLGPAPA